MKAHVVEVGPNAIRRLCCGGAAVVDTEAAAAALEGIDDPLALVDLRPVSVESLWRTVLKSLDCGSPENVIVVHPSWWAPTRVGAVSAGAQVLAGDVVMRPRSWLLRQAAPPESRHGTVVVEIADGVVVITGAAVAAETRLEHQQGVAEAVVRSIRMMATETTETVVIDVPSTVHGAGVLAAMIAAALHDLDSMVVMKIDDIGLRRLAAGPVSSSSQDCGSSGDAAAGHP
ncbi:MAG: type VII secretion-associated protein, partial [Mycobacterium sp.]